MRKLYEKWLNEIGCPEADKKENGGRCGSANYGAWLRKNDPIAFEVGFNEWKGQQK